MNTNLQKAAKQTSQSMNHAAEAVSEKVKEGARTIDKKVKNFDSSELESVYSSVRARAESGVESTYDIVKKYPLYSLLAATAVGMIAGSMIKKIGRN